MTTSDLDLTINRRIAAPAAAVWRAWTTPEYLEQWWCPRPWMARILAFDLQPGGAFDQEMRGPEGQVHVNPGSFLEVVPQSRIAFTSALVAGWRPADNALLLYSAIITMAPNDGGTDYSVVLRHPNAEVSKRHKDMGFHDGWSTATDQLAEVAAGLN